MLKKLMSGLLLLLVIPFVSAAWANTSLDRCMNITVKTAGTSVLTNFPAYINVTDNANMLANFSDLRFYNASCSNGGTLMDYEIENYTATNAHIWVRVPTLTTGNTNISVYYKNNTAVGSGENVAGVWDSNYIGVWHLHENPTGTAPQFLDSKFKSNGTAIGLAASDQVAGVIDGAINFNGTTAKINLTKNASVNGTTQFTLEAWVNVSVVGGRQEIYEESISSGGTSRVKFGLNGAGFVLSLRCPDSGGLTTYASSPLTIAASSARYYVAAVYDNVTSNDRFQINDSVTTTVNALPAMSAAAPYDTPSIGARPSNSEWWHGMIDEFRISNTARSTDWLNQTFEMTGNQASYVTFGTEQSQPSNSCIPTAGQNWLIYGVDNCVISGKSYSVANITINATWGGSLTITNSNITSTGCKIQAGSTSFLLSFVGWWSNGCLLRLQ
jgi:hypothetical protein